MLTSEEWIVRADVGVPTGATNTVGCERGGFMPT